MALPGLVIAVALIGDALIYVVLPLYHQEFGVSLAMVGVLLSLNRWIRLLANSAVAHLGDRVGPHALMIAAAVGSIVSKAARPSSNWTPWRSFSRSAARSSPCTRAEYSRWTS